VELEARGVEGFGLYDLSILRDLKLPTWKPGSVLAWPPPAVPLVLMPAGNFSLPVVGTPEKVAERDRLLHEESERVIAHYKERDRQRAEREALTQRTPERNRQLGRG
jgi:hypothetical protein